MKGVWMAAAAAAAILAGGPAGADVKAGVDAWGHGDYRAAVEQWRGPAAAGDADAQFNLAQAYKLGRGVPADQAMAIEWFRKAAVQGHAQAGDNYGLALFQDGRKSEALPWLEKSAARDEKRAELVLGTMLFNGDAVAKDWVRAYALVTRSSQQGLPQAGQTLAQMDRYIPEAQRQQGIGMARDLEAEGRRLALQPGIPRPSPAPAPMRSQRPPSVASRPTPPAATPPVAPRPTPTTSASRAPAQRPAPAPAPAPAKGPWKVQLGAFRDAGNARDLWAQKGARVGGSPSYVQAGGLTRVFATGFASRAEAQRACSRVGGGCIVTR